MPAFNAENTIRASVDSVLKQRYSNWELIIVNDASIDDTSDIINECAAFDDRIVVVTLHKNGGLPNARNQGINIAKGQWIAFLDSDDLWPVDKLLKQMDFHLKHPEIQISHTGYEMFNEKGIVKRRFKNLVDFNYKKSGLLLPSLYSKNTIGVLTVLVKKQLLISVGCFDAGLWTMEDQDLWIKIGKLNERFGYLPETLAYYRISPAGISQNIYKYKKAYKVFVNKYKAEAVFNKTYNLVLANYYRYFGIVYLKKKAYKISFLYLIKSMSLEKYVLNFLLTGMMLSIGILKSFFDHKTHN